MKNQTPSVQEKAITLGFWSAMLAAVLAITFAVFAIAFPAPEWKNIEVYAHSFNSWQMASFVPAALLSIVIIVLMICLHYYAPEDQKIFSLMAIAFSIIYATFVCTNYYLQLFVVRLNLLSGQLEGLSLLAMPNFHSAFFALEGIGYFFSSLATLVVVPIFSGGKLANWIRGLFILNGVIGTLGVIIAPFDQPYLILASLAGWVLYYPFSMILVGIYLKNAKSKLIVAS